MSALQLYFLGPPRIERDGQAAHVERHKALAPQLRPRYAHIPPNPPLDPQLERRRARAALAASAGS
jgi:hypothetical protein